MANEQNLKSWQPGQSGNPAGKPKGTKHLSTLIQEMMEDEGFSRKLANGKIKKEAPAKVMIGALITKALEGDLRAFELLAKYGYGTRTDVTSGGVQIDFGGSYAKQWVNHDLPERLDTIPGEI